MSSVGISGRGWRWRIIMTNDYMKRRTKVWGWGLRWRRGGCERGTGLGDDATCEERGNELAA